MRKLKANSDMLEALLSQTQKHQKEIVVIKDNLLKIQSANSSVKNIGTVPKYISVSIKIAMYSVLYVLCREKFEEFINYYLKMMILMGGKLEMGIFKSLYVYLFLIIFFLEN